MTIVENYLTGTTDIDAGAIINRAASYRAAILRYLGPELSALAIIDVVVGTETTARRRQLVTSAASCSGDVTPMSATIAFSEPVILTSVTQIAEERPSVATSGAVQLQQCGDATVEYNGLEMVAAPPPPPSTGAGEIAWGFALSLIGAVVVAIGCCSAYAVVVARDGVVKQYVRSRREEEESQPKQPTFFRQPEVPDRRARERAFREANLFNSALGGTGGGAWVNIDKR